MPVTAQAATATDPDIISKSEFARRRNVSAGRVTQWISGGKIDGDALDGEGRQQKIRESVAIRQLDARLDPSQRVANGLGTQLTPTEAAAPISNGVGSCHDEPPGPPPPVDGVLPFSPAQPPSPNIEDRFRQAKLEQALRSNRAAAEAEAARSGLYVLSEQARADSVKLARHILATIEGGLSTMADQIAASLGLSPRDVLHVLRAEFRTMRSSIAKSERERAAAMPEFIEHDPSIAEGMDAVA